MQKKGIILTIFFSLVSILFPISIYGTSFPVGFMDGIIELFFIILIILQLIFSFFFLNSLKKIREKNKSLLKAFFNSLYEGKLSFGILILAILFAGISSISIYVLLLILYGLLFRTFFSLGVYFFFISIFLTAIFIVRWSKNNPQFIVLSRTLLMSFFVFFISCVISALFKTMAPVKNYWSLTFGSGLCGPLSDGCYIFNTPALMILIGIIILLIYILNNYLYLTLRNISAFKRLVIQIVMGACFVFGFMSCFEPSITGKLPQVFVNPLKFADINGFECDSLHWSDYYGIEISGEDILKHHEFVDAYICRAHNRIKDGQYKEALSDFMKLYDIYATDSNKYYLNYPDRKEYNAEVAWLMATSPDNNARNGSMAIEMAKKSIHLYEFDLANHPTKDLIDMMKEYKASNYGYYIIESAGLLQILAAAYAEAGMFKEACKIQEKSIEFLLPQYTEQYSEKKLILDQQLQYYRTGKSCRSFSKSLKRMYGYCSCSGSRFNGKGPSNFQHENN